MGKVCVGIASGVVFCLIAVAPVRASDEFAVDGIHSSVSFKISHMDISFVHGRFNTCKGEITIDKTDPTKSTFMMTIEVDSVDTNQKDRDKHLRSPDFFNVKQFPTMKFKSTAVKAVKDGYQVTGDFTMHGKTKSVTCVLKGGKQAKDPRGMTRIGFSTDFTIKRSDFGMDKFTDMLGDEVFISIGAEGIKK
jgi:polyisoprenoid-binding protein YceI